MTPDLSPLVYFGCGAWLGFMLGVGVTIWAVRRARKTGRLPNVQRAIMAG
jgi:hypothetical protein